MLAQLGLLMAFQFAGEALAAVSGLPVPGPLCGMVLLLGYLSLRGSASEELIKVGTLLTDHLGLLFVPAGAAIVAYGALIASDGMAILTALFVSTVIAVLAAGAVAGRSSVSGTGAGDS